MYERISRDCEHKPSDRMTGAVVHCDGGSGMWPRFTLQLASAIGLCVVTEAL